MAVLGALLDTLRQGNADNRWLVADRIEVQESSPDQLLDALELMLSRGITEAFHPDFGSVDTVPIDVPVDQPLAWKARLRVGTITLSTLMDKCPECLVLADLLDITPIALAQRFTEAARRLGKPGRLVAVGELIENVVNVHVRDSAESLPGRPGQAADCAEQIRRTLDKMRNAMAAREHNLLLMSWAMTVPVAVQRHLTSRCWHAVERTLHKQLGVDRPAAIIGALENAFLADARHVLDYTQRHGERNMILSVRSRGERPRLDAVGPEPFRALILELLHRAVTTMRPPPSERQVRAVEDIIKEQGFLERVTDVCREGDPRRTNLPWIHDGLSVDEMNSVKRLVPKPSGLVFTLRAELPGEGWVALDVPHRPPRLKQMAAATLEGLLQLMGELKRQPEYAGKLGRQLAGATLIASSHGHRYRLLPLHESWADGWMKSDDRTPAEWVEQQVVQPAERGRRHYPKEHMRKVLGKLLEGIELNEGMGPEDVVDEVLKRCDDHKRYKRGPGGSREYRLDHAVRQLSRLLRGEKSVDGTAWSPLRNAGERLSAAVQMLPEMSGGMVVYGDSNWRVEGSRLQGSPAEPVLFGIALDIGTKRVRRYKLVENDDTSLAAQPLWCEPYDFPEFHPE